jgi:hypothetical protein
MPWARIDDAFDDHPKVLGVLEHEQGGAAVGLWTLCLTWAHRNTLKRGKTPGLIAASLPRRYLGPGARDLAALLVKEGLWEPLAEGEGWLIHDFDQYLPTAKTSEARSAAGKRGAASRWAKKVPDSNESSGDGNLPSDNNNEPSSCQDADGKAMASDGSCAPARRAIPNGIAPESRVPSPEPVQQPATPPAAADEPQLTVTQRSKRITDAYAEAEPMCKWPAVNGVVIKAIKSGRYRDAEITAALLRMVPDNRSVTVDSLRTELGGLPPTRSGTTNSASPAGEKARRAMQAGAEVQAMIDEGRYTP